MRDGVGGMRMHWLQPDIVLASRSPRRRAMMRALRVPFRCVVGDDEEDNQARLRPQALVVRHARAKVAAVAARVRRGVLVGADTLVVLGTQVFGKPRSRAEAYRMLRALQGRTHNVYTGVALLDCATRRWRTAHVRTQVTMRPLTTREMTRYFALVNPFDKAGAYAIQEAGGIVIERINGCYYNVLGFPVATVETLLRSLGYSLMARAHAGTPR